MDAKTKSKPPTSDAAVIEATGRSWVDWVKLLDAAAGRTLDQRAIQHALRSNGDVHAGWARMATGEAVVAGDRRA